MPSISASASSIGSIENEIEGWEKPSVNPELRRKRGSEGRILVGKINEVDGDVLVYVVERQHVDEPEH